MHRIAVALGTLVSLIAGCDCGGPSRSCETNDDCTRGAVCIDMECVAPTDAPLVDGDPGMDGGAPCTSDDACGGGVCVAGACCPSASSVCGEACCGAAEACFAGACVTPGATCVRTADCAEGEYCEPALGASGGDAGVPLDGGMTCSGSAAGRCLALPPSCDEAAVGEPCILAECEYRPEVADLDAVVSWRWDPTTAVEQPERVDVWSTPVVGRIVDTNCDGNVDALDSAAIIFVSNDTDSAACHGMDRCRNGILRALDGATGRELWSLASVPGSMGFSGVSLALGDLDDDGGLDIVAITAEAHLAAIAGDGTVMAVGTDTLPYNTLNGLGWGGGLALADMEGDGNPDIGWYGSVNRFSGGAFTQLFSVPNVLGGWRHAEVTTSTSFFVNLDADADLELLAGRTAIDTDGSILWQRTDIAEGFAAVADFDADAVPDVVLVSEGAIWMLRAADGTTSRGPFTLPGTGSGGPPTIADFDGDDRPEIGVAQANRYSVVELDAAGTGLTTLWATLNHDNSSSVTGSTVFDFEGDGIAEVIYNDECYMWVFDGPTGRVRFSASTDSFTGTEASLVADVDGDGHAEMVMISTGADPINWSCAEHMDGSGGYPRWVAPSYGPSWRGITVFRDAARSWVGTRSLWSQHAYHVTNICDERDSACEPALPYGSIPLRERANWTLPWLNNFRQNVLEGGIFDAADATVELRALCSDPLELIVTVRNLGRAILPEGVSIELFQREGATETSLGTVTTRAPIFPGRVEELRFASGAIGPPSEDDVFFARILNPAASPTFRECDDSNDTSADVSPSCLE